MGWHRGVPAVPVGSRHGGGVGDVGMRLTFSPEDLILKLFELSLPSGDVDDQRVLLLLQLGTLLPNHDAQQLGFQALRRPRLRVKVPCP